MENILVVARGKGKRERKRRYKENVCYSKFYFLFILLNIHIWPPSVPRTIQTLYKYYLCIFREIGREGEREEEKHQCVVASHAPPTGDLACNPGMCPNWESNQRPFGSQPVLHALNHTSQGTKQVLISL